jgi:glycosyltransferase involved in cell wall biosynthesis
LTKKKILIILHESSLSGANLALIQSIEILNAEGYKIICIFPYFGPICKRILEINHEIELEFFAYRWWLSGERNFLRLYPLRCAMRNLLAMWDINKLIKNDKPDILISNTIVINIGALLSWKFNIKHIWFIHEFGTLDHGLKFNFGSILGWHLMKKAPGFYVANSQVTSDFIKSKVNRVVTTLYYSFDTVKIKFIPKTIPNLRRFIIMGRITESKGHHIIIDAMNILRNKGVYFHLTILGNIEDRVFFNMIKARICDYGLENQIIYVPHSANPYDIVKDHNFVINCSKMEAFGRMNIEAMLLGIVLLASNSGSSPELIEHGKNGLLFERDSVALAKSIEEALSLTDFELNKMRFYARNYSENLFNVDVYKRKLLAFLESV